MIYFKPSSYPYEFTQVSKPPLHSITLKEGEILKAEVIDILPSGGVVVKAKGIHITLQTEIPLRKDTQLLLKVMDTGKKSNKIVLKLISIADNRIFFNEELKNILKNPEIAEIFLNQLKSVLPEILHSDKKGLFINLLQDFIKSYDLQSVLSNIKNTNFVISIDKLNPEILQKLLFKTGVLMETKIKKGETIEDLKQEILKGNINEKELKDIINYYQSLSVLTGGFFSFIPVLWEDLQQGDILFYKEKKKKSFMCRLELNFRDTGNLTTDIFLLEKDLSVIFFVENKNFEKALKSRVKHLEESLKKYSFRYVFISFRKEYLPTWDIIRSEERISLKV